MKQPPVPPVKPPNSLRELLAAIQLEYGVSPTDFRSIVFGEDDDLTEGLPPPHPQFIQEATAVLRKALEVNPDERRVLDWFLRQHLPDFGMATPNVAIASGHATALLAYLEYLRRARRCGA